jgi:hypothetical protein
MTNFEQYSQILLNAFAANHRNQELVAKKHDLLIQVYEYYHIQPRSVLYMGFNPAIFADCNCKNYVLGVDRAKLNELGMTPNQYQLIDNISQLPDRVDAVVAFDEFFTFFNNELHQRTALEQMKSLTDGVVVTSLRDYKNQDFRDREFSFPSIVKQNQKNTIYLEYHDHRIGAKPEWQTTVYEIDDNQLQVHGPYLRQAVYFKQLAKFVSDAGFVQFSIHKNLMYKSPIRKNYEHVISFR